MPNFHSQGLALLSIQELNKVFNGTDNSSAPIFKALEGMPVTLFVLSESRAART